LDVNKYYSDILRNLDLYNVPDITDQLLGIASAAKLTEDLGVLHGSGIDFDILNQTLGDSASAAAMLKDHGSLAQTLTSIDAASHLPNLSSLADTSKLAAASDAFRDLGVGSLPFPDMPTAIDVAGVYDQLSQQGDALKISLDPNYPAYEEIQRSVHDNERKKADLRGEIERRTLNILESTDGEAHPPKRFAETEVLSWKLQADAIERQDHQIKLLAQIAEGAQRSDRANDARHREIRWWIWLAPIITVMFSVLTCDSQNDTAGAKSRVDSEILEVLRDIRDGNVASPTAKSVQ